jgi:capsid portal protein
MIKSLQFDAIEFPSFKEVRGKDWVSYGSSNLFPQKLIELYQGSSIHHTCVNAKRDATVGEGFKYFGEEIVNSENETLNDILAKIALDYILYGAYSLNLVWNREGSRIAEIYHLPVANVRSGKLNEMDRVEEYYYSSNWSNTRKYTPQVYPAYNYTDNKGDNASQIYYCKQYVPGADVYGLPDYMGCLNDVQLDMDISILHANNISNNLLPGMFITLTNGNATPEERQMMYRDLERSFAGSKNAGKMFLSFVDSPDRAPQIETIDANNDDYYIILSQRIRDSITTAHRVTSGRLIGISEANGFSNNADEIEVAFTHFMGTVIEPIQQTILKTFNPIVKQFGLNVTLEIESNKLDFDQTIENTEE